jgi:two-component system, sensor histidine kinase RpfC
MSRTPYQEGRRLGTFVARLIRRARALIDVLHAKVDAAELGQALFRLSFATIVLVLLSVHEIGTDTTDPDRHVLFATIAYFVGSIVILGRILWAGGVSVVRRYTGIAMDNAGITYFMAMMGDYGAWMFGLYLFIIFGNGFRYGRRYLHTCQVISLLGFGSVLLLDKSSHWGSHGSIGPACFVAMVVLPFYVSFLSQKITDARRRADDANAAKGRFLAMISHEMRTPLNGVIAMADVLRETDLNESQREIVSTLGTSAQLLLAQIEDVLDMAKIEAGRVQIERAAFDMGALLRGTVKVMLPQARYKGLAVNTEISPQANRWFTGDSHHLRQVLLNLLANAIKFTERGEVTLVVNVLTSTSTEARVRFEVKDTGIGISEEKLATIFEPFTQADDSITRVYGGTGLGTSIARQLIKLMGGEIDVVSKVGVGSTFWLEVPLPYAEPSGVDLTSELADTARLSATASALAAQQSTKVTKLRGARVLVAEDNATNQRVTQLILESEGHIATIVDNGEAALDALERGNFDLALFDLSMPGLSGLEALKLYQYTTAKPVPVLILSANVTTEIISQCQQAGCAEFVPKPVRATLLLEAIERHLAERVETAVRPTPPARTEERPIFAVVDTPVIDNRVLEDLGKLSADPTFLERLVRGFKSDANRLSQVIADALAARQYEDAKDAAHALKGGAGSVGASQLVQFAIRLEKASHEMLRTKSAVWIEELSQANAAALAALDQHLEERRRRSTN